MIAEMFQSFIWKEEVVDESLREHLTHVMSIHLSLLSDDESR